MSIRISPIKIVLESIGVHNMFQFLDHEFRFIKNKSVTQSTKICYIRLSDISAISEHDENLMQVTLVNNVEYYMSYIDFERLTAIMQGFNKFHMIENEGKK